MKTTIMVRAGAVVLGVLIFVLFQVTASYAARWNDGANIISPDTSCADHATFFPTSLYTEIIMNDDGSFSAFEIHVANKDGNCSALVYSSNASEGPSSFSRHQNGENLVIAAR